MFLYILLDCVDLLYAVGDYATQWSPIYVQLPVSLLTRNKYLLTDGLHFFITMAS